MALTLQISDSTQTPYSSGASGLVPLRGTASSYAGSPVGEVAGMAGNLVMDNTTGNLWLCTTEGSSGTAVWERMAAYNPVVIAPTASETLPVGTRVIVMPPALTADITLTTPNAGNEGDELLVFGSDSAYTVEVSTGVTTGSPYIEMPDGSQVYSYAIPASSPGAGIRIVWDGTNYRGFTFGQTIVAPATSANQAPQLAQVTNTAPVGALAAAGDVTTVSVTSPTFTAPSNGVLVIIASCTDSAGGASPDVFSTSLAGLVTVYNRPYAYGGGALGYLPMTEGQSTTATFSISDTTAGNEAVWITMIFLPLG